MKHLLLIVMVAAYGCAPIGMPSYPTKPLSEHSGPELCHFYYKNPTPELRQAVQDLVDFTEAEWEMIDAHKINIGMRAEALVCSFGLPKPFGDINNSVGSWGTHTQWVYRKCRTCDALYVYSENGRVTGWSD